MKIEEILFSKSSSYVCFRAGKVPIEFEQRQGLGASASNFGKNNGAGAPRKLGQRQSPEQSLSITLVMTNHQISNYIVILSEKIKL